MSPYERSERALKGAIRDAYGRAEERSTHNSEIIYPSEFDIKDNNILDDGTIVLPWVGKPLVVAKWRQDSYGRVTVKLAQISPEEQKILVENKELRDALISLQLLASKVGSIKGFMEGIALAKQAIERRLCEGS